MVYEDQNQDLQYNATEEEQSQYISKIIRSTRRAILSFYWEADLH